MPPGFRCALAAVLAALALAPAAAAQGDPTVRVVEPDAGATFNATGGAADVPVRLEVERFELETPPTADVPDPEDAPEEAEEPRVGHVHLSLVPRTEEPDIERDAEPPAPGGDEPPPGDQPREGAAPRDGEVPADAILEPGSWAKLSTTDVVITGVPAGEYLLTARLVAPNEGAVQGEGAVDSVPFTVQDGVEAAEPEAPEEGEDAPAWTAGAAVAAAAAAALLRRRA